MRITIAERQKPFSHQPGTFFMLPGTCLRLQIFPALIRVDNLEAGAPKRLEEIPLDIQGPVEDFTIQQDLEKGMLRVWGNTPRGFFRYHILRAERGMAIQVEKAPEKLVMPSFSEGIKQSQPLELERLSLGMSKAQDWTLLRRRKDLAEIFPIWYHLGQLTPQQEYPIQKETLLGQCFQAVENATADTMLAPFNHLFLAGFEGGLSPRLIDEDFQGFPLAIAESKSPMMLLTEGAKLIRSLFLQRKEGRLLVLPALPSEFHCGRLINVHFENLGIIDIEWSKKKIRRMILRPEVSKPLSIAFQKRIKSYRLRKNVKDRGVICHSPTEVSLSQGEIYWFDNFEQ